MIWFYRLLFLPGLLVLGPYYLWRMRRRGGYSEHFEQRFGLGFPALPAKRGGVSRIWIQAVSVGEVLGVEPLLDRLRASGAEIILTTTTSTGFRLAREKYAERVLAVCYFPLDGWHCSAFAWRRFRPDLMILMEGELWPEHMHQARTRGVPLVRVNARLSDRSYRRMRRFAPFARWMLRMPAATLCASAHDCDRLVRLGAPAETTQVTGSLKVDAPLGDSLEGCARLDLLESLGFEDRPVIVGASTWAGEEGALLLAFERCRDAGIDCRLLIVPRHAERRDEICALLSGTRWKHHLRTRGSAPGPVDICVADTTGELRRLVQLGDVVFIGKSLPPHTEGQTPIEAAGFGRAIVLGPGMTNFRGIAAELVECGAARLVRDGSALGTAVHELLRDPHLRRRMGEAGAAWHAENRGAIGRTLAALPMNRS